MSEMHSLSESQGPTPSSSAVAGRSPRALEQELRDLHAENERLLLTMEAIWRIIREKLQVEDQELVRQIVMIDMEDGRLDWRKGATPPRSCPKCERVLSKHRLRCLFCGEPILPEPFER